MTTDDLAPVPLPDERRWRRGVRPRPGVAVVVVAGTVRDLDGPLPTAFLLAGLALWLVELLATPRSPSSRSRCFPHRLLRRRAQRAGPTSAGFLFFASPPPGWASASATGTPRRRWPWSCWC